MNNLCARPQKTHPRAGRLGATALHCPSPGSGHMTGAGAEGTQADQAAARQRWTPAPVTGPGAYERQSQPRQQDLPSGEEAPRAPAGPGPSHPASEAAQGAGPSSIPAPDLQGGARPAAARAAARTPPRRGAGAAAARRGALQAVGAPAAGSGEPRPARAGLPADPPPPGPGEAGQWASSLQAICGKGYKGARGGGAAGLGWGAPAAAAVARAPLPRTGGT